MTETSSPSPVQTHRERLWPGAGALAGVAVMDVFFMLVAVPLGPAWLVGWVALVLAATVAGVVSLSAVVEVRDGVLRAGKARVPLTALGGISVLSREELVRALGPGRDPASYLLIRGWVPGAVVVMIDDPDDPAPYWIVSSRRPEALAQAAHSRQTA